MAIYDCTPDGGNLSLQNLSDTVDFNKEENSNELNKIAANLDYLSMMSGIDIPSNAGIIAPNA